MGNTTCARSSTFKACASTDDYVGEDEWDEAIVRSEGMVFAVGNMSWFTIPELLSAFHRAVPDRQVLIYVPTAISAVGAPAEDVFGLAEQRRQSLGYKVVIMLDFQSQKVREASRLLENAGNEACIYIEGGNTFALRHFARPFDQLCKRAVQCQGVSCVGVSAGALLVSSTVQPALWKGLDDPSPPSIPRLNWHDSNTASGWDLVDGLTFFLHFGPEWHQLVQHEQVKWKYEYHLMTIDDSTLTIFEAGSNFPNDIVTAKPFIPQPSSPTSGMDGSRIAFMGKRIHSIDLSDRLWGA